MQIKKAESKITDEWGTPDWLFDELHDEFTFRVDVCANAKNAKLSTFFNKRTDGLKQHWDKNFFCNPPYSDQLPWVIKAKTSVNCCPWIEGVGVYKHDPSTKHGQFIAEYADELRILSHRIAFKGAPNVANFPTVVAVWRRRLHTRKSAARVLYMDYRKLIG